MFFNENPKKLVNYYLAAENRGTYDLTFERHIPFDNIQRIGRIRVSMQRLLEMAIAMEYNAELYSPPTTIFVMCKVDQNVLQFISKLRKKVAETKVAMIDSPHNAEDFNPKNTYLVDFDLLCTNAKAIRHQLTDIKKVCHAFIENNVDKSEEAKWKNLFETAIHRLQENGLI